MIDLNKPVQTVYGKRVRILSTEGPNKHYPIVGYAEGSTALMTWTTDGKYTIYHTDDANNLVNVEEAKEFYLVVKRAGVLEGQKVSFNADEAECYRRDVGVGHQRLKLTFRGGKLVASEILQPEES